jgi:glycine/D-amino acid oxidase-like deaminating enzyme
MVRFNCSTGWRIYSLKYHHGTAMVSQPVPRVIFGPVVGGGFLTGAMLKTTTLRIGLSAVQSARGSVIIGQGTEEKELDSKDVPLKTFHKTAKNFSRYFPKLMNLEIVRVWTAVTPYTNDGLPICGFSSKVPNLFTAAGFKGAFTTAPAIGVKVVEYIRGRSNWPIEMFSQIEFKEGSN